MKIFYINNFTTKLLSIKDYFVNICILSTDIKITKMFCSKVINQQYPRLGLNGRFFKFCCLLTIYEL